MKFIKHFESYNTLDKNLSILKSYITIINKYKVYTDFAKKFFIILHNFLIIEELFKKEVITSGKELNKHLDLEKLDSANDVFEIFKKLYDVNHIIRNNIENFTRIDVIKQFVQDKSYLYTKLFSKKDIERLKDEIAAKKYNL